MSIKKSDLLNKFSDNYPSFLKKDLKKFVDIILSEMRNSLRRHERVELRDIFSIEPRLQRARFARNPKTNEKIYIEEKYSLILKTSKFWTKKINEEK
mgnify:CR=1 FL=1